MYVYERQLFKQRLFFVFVLDQFIFDIVKHL